MEQGPQTEQVCRTPSVAPPGEFPGICIRSAECGAWVAKRITQELRKRGHIDSEGVLTLNEIADLCRENGWSQHLQHKAALMACEWEAKLSQEQAKFAARMRNASLYVPADKIVCSTTANLRAVPKNVAAVQVSNTFARRLIRHLLSSHPSRHGSIDTIVREMGYKHLLQAAVVRGLSAPGLMHAVARHLGVYRPSAPPVVSLESTALTPELFSAYAGSLLADAGYIPVEGRKAFEVKDAAGDNSWYFDSLLRTFGDAVAFMSYVLSLTSPLLPDGFFPDMPINFREKKIMVDGVMVPAGVDGSGTYHPEVAALQPFLKANMATFRKNGKKRQNYPAIQIRVWNPDTGLFAKGMIIPDANSLDDNGQPAVVLGLNQIKGTMKEDHSVKEALANDTSVVLVGHMGVMKTWKEQSTLKSCFELLQLATSNPATRAAVRKLVKVTFDGMRKRGIRGLISDSSNGNTTLTRLIALVLKAQSLGVEIKDAKGVKRLVSLLDIDAVRKTAVEKLRRRLYNAANGTGFEGNQVVIIMDSAVKRGHVVLGESEVLTPEVGEVVSSWRFPAILAQSLKTLTIQAPSPHHVYDGDIIPYVAFMNPADVTDLQGDDDGDIGAWTSSEEVRILADNKIDKKIYRIEPEGEKVKITADMIGEFSKYVSVDPMGPVGQATVAQARFYELAQIGPRLFWAYRFHEEGAEVPVERRVKEAEGEILAMTPEARKAFNEALLTFREKAYSWARAFGVFIQESIDRAKRFVRWTDIPTVAELGDAAWKAMKGQEELYCHWATDENGDVVPWKTAGLEGRRSDHYLPLTNEKLQTVNPLDLLSKFVEAASAVFGEEAVMGAVLWRRNFTQQGERLMKRIDPDSFPPREITRPGLVEEAYSATQHEWQQVKAEFAIPDKGADLSDLLELTLQAACPGEMVEGTKMSWAEAIAFYRKAALSPKATEKYAYARTLWTKMDGSVDEVAFSALTKAGKLDRGFLHQAHLDYGIKQAMALGNRVIGDAVLEKGHNEDEDPSRNPRIAAIEMAYAKFNRDMSDSVSSRGVAWLLAAYAMEVANRDLHIAREGKRRGAEITSYNVMYGRPSTKDVPASGYVLAKMDRALDLALFEGSPIAAKLGLSNEEQCYYEWMPDCRKAVRLITALSTNEERVSALSSAIFDVSYGAFEGQLEEREFSEIKDISLNHFIMKGTPLHACQACMAALRKEVVDFNRYGVGGSQSKGDRLEKLASSLTQFLRGKNGGNAVYGDTTHFNTIREKMIRAIGKLEEEGTYETGRILQGLKSDRLWSEALQSALSDMEYLEEGASDDQRPAKVKAQRSAKALYAQIFGLESLKQGETRFVASREVLEEADNSELEIG